MSNFIDILKTGAKNLTKWAKLHEAELYEAGALIGLGVSVASTATGAIKASKAIEKLRETEEYNSKSKAGQVLEEGKIVVKYCGVGLGTMAATGCCIHKVYAVQNEKIIAATFASNMYKRALDEQTKKIEQKFGKEKAEEIKNEIKEDHIKEELEKNPSILNDIPAGDVIMWDDVSKQYFYSNTEKLSLATNDILNRMYNYNEMYVTLNEILDCLGEKTLDMEFANKYGCDMDTGFRIDKSTHQIDEDHACIAISYMTHNLSTGM